MRKSILNTSFPGNPHHTKCCRCIKEIKDSAKILNQETKGFITISDFVHPDLRRVALLFYLCSLE